MACSGFLSNADTTFTISIPTPPVQEIQNSNITLVLFGTSFTDNQPYEVIISDTPSSGYSGPPPIQSYNAWEAGISFTGQQLFDLADHNQPGGLGVDGADVQGAKFRTNSGNCANVTGSTFANIPDNGITCFPEGGLPE